MRVHISDHPLVAQKLTVLRDVETPSSLFRQVAEELVTLLAYEATRQIRVQRKVIQTPLMEMEGVALHEPPPIVVPILRAGLGILAGLLQLLPTAEVGFLGLKRDETTLEAITYANRMPEHLSDRQVFILEPMLATGGSLLTAIEYMQNLGARDIICICLLAAPEGVAKLQAALGDESNVTLVVAAVDQGLNENAYIVPGLGDAGDRLYGVID